MRDEISHHLWYEEEMVIIYPDRIASFVLTHNGLCKCSVDRNIVFPAIFLPDLIFGVIRDLVMECWPDDLFAISIVVAFHIGVRDEYWNRIFRSGKQAADF